MDQNQPNEQPLPTERDETLTESVQLDDTSRVEEAALDAADSIEGELAGVADALQDAGKSVVKGAANVAAAAGSSLKETVKSEVEHKRDQAKDAVAARADEVKERAADKIEGVAETIYNRHTLPHAQVIDHAGDRVSEAASYVREHQYSEMQRDFEMRVRESPLASVLLAFVIGLLLGSSLKRG